MKDTKRLMADYEKLSLADDFMFCKIMSKPKNCIEMLQRLTGNKIEKVKTITDQKVIQVTSDSKGIRYDVYVEDNNNIVYDSEMQRKRSEKETGIEILSKRVRAYQGLMDKKKAGDKYTQGLDEQVKVARMNKEWRVEYMKTYFHDNDIREEGKLIQLIELVEDGTISIATAIEKSGLTEQEFMDYYNGEYNEQ